MENNNRIDTSISGSGSIAGGCYNDVKISGSGKVTGDLDCTSFRISGSGKAVGNVKATEEIKISGSGKITGSVETKSFKGSGSFKLEGAVNAKEFKASGTGKLMKGLEGESATITGYIKVAEDVEVDFFKATGAFNIDGLLNAETIQINLNGGIGSKCKEIGGQKIKVTRFSEINILYRLFSNGGGCLEVDTIEGDDINIDHTKAKKVCGDDVYIGEGCKIDEVEYRNVIKVSPDAHVGKIRQMSESVQEEELNFDKE